MRQVLPNKTKGYSSASLTTSLIMRFVLTIIALVTVGAVGIAATPAAGRATGTRGGRRQRTEGDRRDYSWKREAFVEVRRYLTSFLALVLFDLKLLSFYLCPAWWSTLLYRLFCLHRNSCHICFLLQFSLLEILIENLMLRVCARVCVCAHSYIQASRRMMSLSMMIHH